MTLKLLKISTIISIIVIAVVITSGCISGTPVYKTFRYDMISLDRTSSASGSFILGSGSVDGSPAYIYYIELPNGGYKLKSVKASKCILFENENTTPYITMTYKLSDSYINRNSYSQPYGDTGDERILTRLDGDNLNSLLYLINEVEIHIPAGSIVREFTP
jgi:hypothetical protein